MRITTEAKEYFLSQFDDIVDGIIINVNKSCCVIGEDIKIAFAKIDDNYVIIDGIKVQYDKYTEGFLKKLVIDYKNNMIEFGDEGNE